MKKQSNVAILLAAGSGTRMRSKVEDKIQSCIHGKSVFEHSLRAFVESLIIDKYIVVVRDEEQRMFFDKIISKYDLQTITQWASGGAERKDSVWNALKLLQDEQGIVAIHDAARPLIQHKAIRKLFETAEEHSAACAARPVTDTIKRIDQVKYDGEPVDLEDLERSRLWSMETPQVFDIPLIYNAYKKIECQPDAPVTDDVAVAQLAGYSVSLVTLNSLNIKITHPDDIALAEFLLMRKA